MTLKLVVGYDGSDAGQRALTFAIEQASALGGSIVLAHVLDWSPYSFLTNAELEERHKRRSEELERAETAILAPALTKFADSGVEMETVMRYGHIAKTLCDICTETGATQLILGREGASTNLSDRLFGSVASTLAQAAPVPVTIIP